MRRLLTAERAGDAAIMIHDKESEDG